MKIIVYGLEQTKPGPPDARIHRCEDQTSLFEMVLTLQPDYIIVHKDKAEWVLDEILSTPLHTNIVVVCELENPEITRFWTAKGAADAWSELRWEDKLHSLSSIPRNDPDTTQDSHTYKYKPRRSEIITVGGVYSGVGSTHMSILIASYLSRYFRTKVAILEYGKKPCFHQFDMLYNGQIKSADRLRFEIDDLTFLKAAHFSQYAADDFDYVVIDMGELEDAEEIAQFFKSSLPVLLASSNEWRLHELLSFCRKNGDYFQDRMRIAFPFGEKHALNVISKVLEGRALFSVPLHSDPFVKQADTDENLEGILYPLLPKKPRNGISRFFGGK